MMGSTEEVSAIASVVFSNIQANHKNPKWMLIYIELLKTPGWQFSPWVAHGIFDNWVQQVFEAVFLQGRYDEYIRFVESNYSLRHVIHGEITKDHAAQMQSKRRNAMRKWHKNRSEILDIIQPVLSSAINMDTYGIVMEFLCEPSHEDLCKLIDALPVFI
jgi:hypothetical protein